MIEGPKSGWGSVRVVTTFVLSALAPAGFILRESRTASPMLDLRLFRSRSFTATGVVAVLVMFGLVGTLFLLSLFFGGLRHERVSAVVLRFLVVTGPIVVTGPPAARMARVSMVVPVPPSTRGPPGRGQGRFSPQVCRA